MPPPRAALCTDMHFLDPLHVLLPLHLLISGPICFSQFPTHRPHNGQMSLNDNVTAVLLPKQQLFAMAPANFAEGNARCAPAPVLTLPTSKALHAKHLRSSLYDYIVPISSP